MQIVCGNSTFTMNVPWFKPEIDGRVDGHDDRECQDVMDRTCHCRIIPPICFNSIKTLRNYKIVNTAYSLQIFLIKLV